MKTSHLNSGYHIQSVRNEYNIKLFKRKLAIIYFRIYMLFYGYLYIFIIVQNLSKNNQQIAFLKVLIISIHLLITGK